MNEPPPEDTFTLHSNPFQKPGRRNILDVAGRPHAIKGRLVHGPSNHPRHSFAHEALPPPPLRERVTKIDGACAHANLDEPRQRTVFLAPEGPRKGRTISPDALASTQEVDRLLDTA